MNRGTWIAVGAAVAVIAAVGALALQAARHDRAALVSTFGDEHLSRLRIGIREIESELSAMGQHLEFASRLVSTPESRTGERRELEALLAVAPSYLTIAVYDGEVRERVVASSPQGAGLSARPSVQQAFAETARAAVERQGMTISEPLGDAAVPWLRAFAVPLARNGRPSGALVILVDQRTWFERLRLLAPGEASKLLLFGPHGRSTPVTDTAIMAAIDGGRAPASLTTVLGRMRAGHTGTFLIPGRDAEILGLGPADAVAVFAPIRTADAGHWSAALVDSTAPLGAQERAIFQRMAALGLTFATALAALAVHLVLSARRTIAVKEQLRTAEQVAHLREKAEKILENAPVGVLTFDERESISGANRAVRERLSSASPGRSLEQAFPEAGAQALQALRTLIRDARAAGAVRRVIEPPLSLAAGAYFAVHAVPLDHPSPDLSMLVVLEDVTELRALSGQLLRAEKLATVGVLSAGLAHEIGTPLGVMRGRAEMLVNQLGAGHPQGGSAQVIVDEIDRISRIIRELLDFSRTSPEVGEIVLLSAVAKEVADLLSFEARTRKVAIDLEVPAALPPLAANPDQLKQVLVNLVLNALHASPPGTRVVIRARVAAAGRCLLEVVDHGAGIPENLRHRVFDPFFTTKKRGKGTGLGLTVAAQIVRNHGGELDLESAIGQGTRVVVEWPLAVTGKEEHDGRPEGRAHLGGG